VEGKRKMETQKGSLSLVYKRGKKRTARKGKKKERGKSNFPCRVPHRGEKKGQNDESCLSLVIRKEMNILVSSGRKGGKASERVNGGKGVDARGRRGEKELSSRYEKKKRKPNWVIWDQKGGKKKNLLHHEGERKRHHAGGKRGGKGDQEGGKKRKRNGVIKSLRKKKGRGSFPLAKQKKKGKGSTILKTAPREGGSFHNCSTRNVSKERETERARKPQEKGLFLLRHGGKPC